MDPVPVAIAAVVGSALVAAVLALWRMHVLNTRRCDARGDALEKEIKETKKSLIDLHASRAESAEQRAAEYARHASQMSETARVCAKVLRRFENTPIPPEPSGGTSAIHRTQK